LRLDYFPYLFDHLIHILSSKRSGEELSKSQKTKYNQSLISSLISILDLYGLSKDDLSENLKELMVRDKMRYCEMIVR